MDTNATYENYKHFGPNYLKALNVQSALGYHAHWIEYERALGQDMRAVALRDRHDAAEYVSSQVLLAVLGELA